MRRERRNDIGRAVRTGNNGRFELTDDTRKVGRSTVYRIRALKPFSTGDNGLVKVGKGDLGGYVSSADLIHGNAWVMDEAVVMGNALVNDNAVVSGNSVVSGEAFVSGNARIAGCAKVSGRARVFDDALVDCNARVSGDSLVSGDARILDHAHIDGHAEVGQDAEIRGWSHVGDFAIVAGHASVSGSASVSGDARVVDNAKVHGEAKVRDRANVTGSADITGDAVVSDSFDYAVYKNTWSSGRYVTYTRSNGLWKAGCFHGTSEQLLERARGEGVLKFKCYSELVGFQKRIDELRVKDSKKAKSKTERKNRRSGK